MANEYYDHTTYPANGAHGSASALRSELDSIETGLDKLPTLAGNGSKIVAVNSGGTALEAVTTTGTGNAVRATSPALVTPVLGIPTSGTLTNCTGLPVVNGTTGTLSAARGGTGQTTFTDGQLLVGKTDGTLAKATLTAGDGVSITNGDGTITIAAAAPADNEVVVHTGNGHGSTNIYIRRFTTVLTNVGTAITYADSATDGATFAINEAGYYAISYTDGHSTSLTYFGVSLNSASLGNPISGQTAAVRLIMTRHDAGVVGLAARVVKLAVNDVIRAHTGQTDNASNEVMFSIRKIANV